MKELMRIEHAEGNRETGSALQDYNMEIYEREILYIQGADGSGIREIASVLSGDIPLFKGNLTVEADKVSGYNRKKAYGKHIFPISAERSMIYNLTVAENMEALCDQDFFMKPYVSRRMERKVDEFLRREGVHIRAGSLGSHLCTEEAVQLSILKAKLHGAGLVILEALNSTFEGTYADEICSLIRKLCDGGISFIILSSSYSCFAKTATRIQFVYRGRDLKEWRTLDGEVVRLLKSQNPDSFLTADESMEQKKRPDKGTFLGICDYEWENDKSVWNFLREVKACNESFWEKNLKVSLPEDGVAIRQGVLVIPKESGSLWFDNLRIEDNLLMSIPRKIAGSRYGILRKNRSRHVVNRFYEIFHIDREIREMKELSKIQRKLFSIYRFELLHPKTIFLENPYWGMDQEEIMQIRDYLEEIQQRGSRIVCCARSIDEMEKDCCAVIRTDHARNARVIRA